MARSEVVEELDIQMALDYADDPEVEIVEAVVDYNAPHGSNEPEEMDVE